MTMDRALVSAPAQPGFGRLAGNVGFLAARFSYFAAKIAREALEPFDLSTRLYSLLELAATGTGMSQREIGRALCLDPSNVLRLVDQLHERGLVERERDPADRRRTTIRATASGARLAAEAGDAIESRYAPLLDGTISDRRSEVMHLLAQLGLEAEASIH
jgi:DNA-binding MarR family transcriptional regulator